MKVCEILTVAATSVPWKAGETVRITQQFVTNIVTKY